MRLTSLAAVLTALGAGAQGGGEIPVSPADAPPALMPSIPTAGLAGDIYREYMAYNAHVRRSYVPGFIPNPSSLFENPRERPSAVCVLGDTYRYANLRGWFFGSPNGYQSSVPPGSQAHAYVTGQLGITTALQYGYPRGQRVIEPVLVPYAAYAEAGGILITSEGVSVRPTVPLEQPALGKGAGPQPVPLPEKTGVPPPSLVPQSPASIPSLPEVIEK